MDVRIWEPLFNHLGYDETVIMARFVRFPRSENVRFAILEKKAEKVEEMMKDPPRIGDVGPTTAYLRRRKSRGRQRKTAWDVAYLFTLASESYDEIVRGRWETDRTLSDLLQVQIQTDVPAAIKELDEDPFLVNLWNQGHRLEGDISPGLCFAMFLRRYFELASSSAISSLLIRSPPYNLRFQSVLQSTIRKSAPQSPI